MSYFRSYFSKNNTILSNSRINTAKNPDTEIYYGNGFSKYIFKVNLTDLQTRINNGDLVLTNDTKHYLHLTNTIFGDSAFLGQDSPSERQRATSFDLIVFPITLDWDEGVGFDYENTLDFATGNKTYDERPSNWYNRTTTDLWDENGIYTTAPTEVLNTIHFDNGNEDIHVDITNYINGIISGDTNNGLGIAFDYPYSLISSIGGQSVSFFTKYTQTFYEPFVESVFEDTISDDRDNFINDIQRNLYLYVTDGVNFIDLDDLPNVDVLDNNKQPLEYFTGMTTTKIRKGIYKVTFGLSGTICDGKRFFYDKWYNLTINGVEIPDVVQKFIPKPITSLYTFGANPTEFNRYSLQYYGIKLNEKVKRGDLRKITVNLRSVNERKNVLTDDIYYRIYIVEGKGQVNVFDWTKMDRTNENSFILNTEYLIPREYNIEIKGKINSEEIHYNEIKFEIVSEK